MRPDGRGRLFALGMLALGLVSCRQTVVLDQVGGPDGGGGLDSGFDISFGDCQRVGSTLHPPSIVIALDRSTAMSQTVFGNGGTRLTAAETAIQTAVLTYQTQVPFGYEEFPGANQSCGSSGNNGCCPGEVTPPTKFGFAAIMHTMSFCDLSPAKCIFTDRPTAGALATIQQSFSTFDANGGNRYVILMTGMEPSCSAFGDPPCQAAKNAAASLNNNPDSIKTIVLGIGDDVASSDCLDNLAFAGGQARSVTVSPFYYLARTPSDLNDRMSTIVDGIVEDTCSGIDVHTSLSDPTKVAVLIDGVLRPFSRSNGWDVDTSGQGSSRMIDLHGDACQALLHSQNANPIDVFMCSQPTH